MNRYSKENLLIDYRDVQEDLRTAYGQRYNELLIIKNLIYKKLYATQRKR